MNSVGFGNLCCTWDTCMGFAIYRQDPTSRKRGRVETYVSANTNVQLCMKLGEEGRVAADSLSAVERKEGLWRRSEAPWDITISTSPYSSSSSSSSSSFSSCFISATEVPRDIISSSIAFRTLPTPLNRQLSEVTEHSKWILVTMPKVKRTFLALFIQSDISKWVILVCTEKCLNSRT